MWLSLCCCLYVVVFILLFLCCCLYVVVFMLLSLCCCLYVVVFMLLSLCCCLYVVVFMLLSLCCCLYVAVVVVVVAVVVVAAVVVVVVVVVFTTCYLYFWPSVFLDSCCDCFYWSLSWPGFLPCFVVKPGPLSPPGRRIRHLRPIHLGRQRLVRRLGPIPRVANLGHLRAPLICWNHQYIMIINLKIYV